MWVYTYVAGPPTGYQVGYYVGGVWPGMSFVPEVDIHGTTILYAAHDLAANRVNFLNGGTGLGRFQV